MKKLFLFILMIHTMLIGMDLSMTKNLDLIFSYKPYKKIFAPLPLYRLDDLIISDKHIKTYIEQYQQGNREYLNRVKAFSLYELSKISSEKDNQKLVELSKRLHVLDTMLDQFNSKQFSRIIPINSPSQATNPEKYAPVHPSIRDKKNRTDHKPELVEKIKLSENNKGQYITINGNKVYVIEGQHVKVLGIDWVVSGNKLINLAISGVIIDKNDNCHIRDLTGQLRCLHHGKNEWVSWGKDVYIYKDKQLQFIPHGLSIIINGKKLINYQGNLCFVESTQSNNIFKSVLLQGMQQEIIDILGKSTNHTMVVQRLDAIIQEVLLQAQERNYEIHPEFDWRLQTALKAIPQSMDSKEFTFHLATIEHLVNDIQIQTAQNSHEHMPFIERSPILLAQAISKYFEYLAPTEGEISLIVDLARYVSDVTIGTQYLSTEVRTQRIEQFWNTIKNISFENLSKVSAEQIIDGAMYVAARATYACGVPEAIAVIKEIFEGMRIAASFAERFKKQFDQVLQDNPIIVTHEGTVIANASKEAVAEARHLIQAFDGMKDKPSDKQPPEILDESQKVVERENKFYESKNEVSSIIKNKFAELAKDSRNIKGLQEKEVANPKHLFKIKHELHKLDISKEEVMLKIIEMILKADKIHMFNLGSMTRIFTTIKDHEIEIHLFLDKQGILWSFNAFVGYSNRLLPVPIRI